jgi:hypothetical protein
MNLLLPDYGSASFVREVMPSDALWGPFAVVAALLCVVCPRAPATNVRTAAPALLVCVGSGTRRRTNGGREGSRG